VVVLEEVEGLELLLLLPLALEISWDIREAKSILGGGRVGASKGVVCFDEMGVVVNGFRRLAREVVWWLSGLVVGRLGLGG
jgi:hypothetical protein